METTGMGVLLERNENVERCGNGNSERCGNGNAERYCKNSSQSAQKINNK